MKKFVKMFMVIAMSAAMVACGDDGKDAPDPGPDPVPVTSVTVAPKTVTLKVGEKQALTATVAPANADDKSVTWKSEAVDIVTVSSSGELEAKAVGTTTITVASVDDPSKKDVCEVTVKEEEVPLVYEMPKTAVVNGVTFTYTMTGDKISKIVASKDVESMEYVVKFDGTICTVDFEDPYNGASRYRFTLNDVDMAASVESCYVNSDGSADVYDNMEFEYTDGMLTKITDLRDPTQEDDTDIELFAGVYKDGAFEGYKAASLGDYGFIEVASSDKLNNCAIDPIYMFPLYGMDALLTLNAEAAAVFCGLLPHAKYLPAKLVIAEEDYPVAIELDGEKVLEFNIAEASVQVINYTY